VDIRGLAIGAAFSVTPLPHRDDRGTFLEWFRQDALTAAVGHDLAFAQANCSVSSRGVIRGVHYADVPPGQAKYVTCARGAVLDVVVDLRVGSPTFGRWEAVRLDDVDRRAVYLGEGLGHAFCALEDDSVVMYLCSTAYNPGAERTVHPLDPDLAIAWPLTDPRLSPKDSAAPSLREAVEAGTLPAIEACRAWDDTLALHAAAHRRDVEVDAGPAGD
jgi:dTDP-4-dehydrorhamnose 3,5-epimerase